MPTEQELRHKLAVEIVSMLQLTDEERIRRYGVIGWHMLILRYIELTDGFSAVKE